MAYVRGQLIWLVSAILLTSLLVILPNTIEPFIYSNALTALDVVPKDLAQQKELKNVVMQIAGFDKSLVEQSMAFWSKLFTGDFGYSLQNYPTSISSDFGILSLKMIIYAVLLFGCCNLIGYMVGVYLSPIFPKAHIFLGVFEWLPWIIPLISLQLFFNSLPASLLLVLAMFLMFMSKLIFSNKLFGHFSKQPYAEFARQLGMGNHWLRKPMYYMVKSYIAKSWLSLFGDALLLIFVVLLLTKHHSIQWFVSSVQKFDLPVIIMVFPLLFLLSSIRLVHNEVSDSRFTKIRLLVLLVILSIYALVLYRIERLNSLLPLLAFVVPYIFYSMFWLQQEKYLQLKFPMAGIAILFPLWMLYPILKNQPWIAVLTIAIALPWIGVNRVITLILCYLLVANAELVAWPMLIFFALIALLMPRKGGAL